MLRWIYFQEEEQKSVTETGNEPYIRPLCTIGIKIRESIMIKKLQNNEIETSGQIYNIFQLSYAVEAELLDANDFPPLKRPLESYLKSRNDFYGYFENNELAGVIEVERIDKYIDINSLVVMPKFFRQGIGRKLIEFTFNRFDSKLFIVETGVKNKPAIELYKKLGFKEIKQWDTDFGIRKVLFEKKISN